MTGGLTFERHVCQTLSRSPIKRGERSPGRRDRSGDEKKEGRERSPGQVALVLVLISQKSCDYLLFPLQVARDVGSKVEKAEKPEVPKFVVDRYTCVVARL